MKKQLIGFILPLLICVLTPTGAAAFLFMFMITSPWPGQPGGSFPFTVEVQENGSLVEGQTVTFSVSPDDGTVSFSVTTATTDSDGKVFTSLRLGSDASGSYTVTASVGTSSISATVTVETTDPDPDPEFSISAVSTTAWTGAPDDSFTFTVQVQEDGSPAQGETVTFSVSPDNGTASAESHKRHNW